MKLNHKGDSEDFVKVNAFIAQVSEFVDAGKITKTAGDKLTSGAYDLLVSLA